VNCARFRGRVLALAPIAIPATAEPCIFRRDGSRSLLAVAEELCQGRPEGYWVPRSETELFRKGTLFQMEIMKLNYNRYF